MAVRRGFGWILRRPGGAQYVHALGHAGRARLSLDSTERKGSLCIWEGRAHRHLNDTKRTVQSATSLSAGQGTAQLTQLLTHRPRIRQGSERKIRGTPPPPESRQTRTAECRGPTSTRGGTWGASPLRSVQGDLCSVPSSGLSKMAMKMERSTCVPSRASNPIKTLMMMRLPQETPTLGWFPKLRELG